MKTRTVNGGGLYIKQFIIFGLVLSYCNNKAWFNGKKGRSFGLKLKKHTAL